MREILFRGKRIDNGDFTEGYLYGIWDRTYILWGQANHFLNGEEVIPETVGQFTGLTDKNGTMIFEGDILCANTGVKWDNGIHSEYLQYAQVVYNDQKARFEILGKMGESHKALDQVVNKCRALLCGNIHEGDRTCS